MEKLVQDRVDSGRYTSASEVVREALRLLDAHDKEREARLAQLRSDVDAGMKHRLLAAVVAHVDTTPR